MVLMLKWELYVNIMLRCADIEKPLSVKVENKLISGIIVSRVIL